MSKQKIAYWVVTAPFALMMTASAYMYLSGAPELVESFRHMGYPDYFRMMLGIAKLLGAVALVAPVPRFLKEWAYAGFVINMIAAAVSHGASGDGAGKVVVPLVFLGVVLASHQLWTRVSAGSTQAEPAVQPARA